MFVLKCSLVLQDPKSVLPCFVFLPHSELLEKLCLSLYDVLRPMIIHVIHLETLSELCGILKNEMLEDHVQNNGNSEVEPHGFDSLLN